MNYIILLGFITIGTLTFFSNQSSDETSSAIIGVTYGNRAKISMEQAVQPDTMDTCTIKDKTYFLIETEKQLRSIGSNSKTLGWNYMLINDISLTKEWKPIGTEDNPFTGRFEGNGAEIRNLNVTASGLKYYGMFGFTAKESVVHNVTLRDPVFKNTQGGSVGAIVAICNGESYDNHVLFSKDQADTDKRKRNVKENSAANVKTSDAKLLNTLKWPASDVK